MPSQQSNKSPVSLLPPELLDSILDYLHPEEWEVKWTETVENKRDLHNCSLVSRAWNTYARPHLFRDVAYSFMRPDIGAEPPFRRSQQPLDYYWMEFAEARRNARHKTLEMFTAFLRDNPRIQRYIRRLKLDAWPLYEDYGYDSLGSQGSGWAMKEADFVDASLFEQLLHCLPALQVLHLYNVVLRQPVQLRPSPRTPLRRLHIASYACKPFGDSLAHSSVPQSMITNILSHFTSIDELHLSAMHLYAVQEQQHMPHLTTLSHLRVKSLMLDSTQIAEGFMEALAASPAIKNIRRLSFFNRQECGGTVPTIPASILTLMAPNVLQFRYNLHRGHTSDNPLVDISAFVNLEEVTIGITIRDGEDDMVERCARNVSKLLGYLKGSLSNLREVVLEITLPDGVEPAVRNKDYYHPVDESLSRLIARSPALLGIAIEVVGGEKESSVNAAIEKMLPVLYAQRRLHFRSVRVGIWQEHD